jgi:hypothetical protein
MLAEDAWAYGPVYMLKYSGEFRKPIWHAIVNLLKGLS